ncbi:hypothetical protein D3C81_1618870 [compost metagenome]
MQHRQKGIIAIVLIDSFDMSRFIGKRRYFVPRKSDFVIFVPYTSNKGKLLSQFVLRGAINSVDIFPSTVIVGRSRGICSGIDSEGIQLVTSNSCW